MTNKKIKVAVIGASGYTGGELLRLLSGHPHVSIALTISSEKSAGRALTELFPNLTSILSLPLENLEPGTVAKQVDFVFLALPHTQAIPMVATFLECGKSVIDLSADFRLKESKVYEQWYGTPHTAPHLLQEAVYGLPELHRTEIQKAKLIAVPGCFPTAAILQLAPFIARNLIDIDSIIIDAKSGVSGAGRGLALGYHFPEAHDGIHAYNIGTHRHLPEIQQELGILSTKKAGITRSFDSLSFTPHLVPMNRGILSTAYATLSSNTPHTDCLGLYKDFYKNEPFIRLFDSPDLINPNHVRGSNFCDLGVTHDPQSGRLVMLAAIDNLVKGAAGQAIQAMNLILGIPENEGLRAPGLFP